MGFFKSLAAVACLVASVDAFAPISSPISSASPRRSTTQTLNLMSDQEIFDTIRLDNGGYGRYGYDRYRYGYGGYRGGGMDYFPRGGSLARGYYGYGGYPDYRGEFYNGMGYNYGYDGYNYGYDYGYDRRGYGEMVQGHSRRTFSTGFSDSSTVQLETDGRPLNANVEVWQGAGHSPAKMRLYSEDGYLRPWVAGFANTPRGGYSTAVSINNEASQSFPIYANVAGSPYGGGYDRGYYGGYGRGYGGGYGGAMGTYVGSSRRRQVNIDGGALRTFSFGPDVRAIVVEVWSENFPFYADVELWDGPNSVKQAAEVYSDSGWDRPWSAIIENPRGGTICVRNVGPLEFPMKVCVEPIF